jgi:hypothetical protein
MRPVVILLLEPAGDTVPRFFQAPKFRRPDFLFLQAAMEPLDVGAAFRLMIEVKEIVRKQPPEVSPPSSQENP